MNQAHPVENIYLVGPMGAGKSTIGRLLAKSLERTFVDTDHEIESRTGVSISTVFSYEGEAGFRKREHAVIQQLVTKSSVVIATGGGAVLDEKNRNALKNNGFVVYLSCSVDKLLNRTRGDTKRPLLQTPDRRERLQSIIEERDPLYQECADLIIDTGSIASKNAVNTILDAVKKRMTHKQDKNKMTTVMVELVERSYPIRIGDQILATNTLLRELISSSQTLVVTNDTVAPLYLDKILTHLEGLQTASLILPDGEQYKTMNAISSIIDALMQHQFSRNATLIALGGGVIGDIAGFAAACYQRGIPFIQIPTTLLAQVDSSVGGKTGVNHPQGKNMIGSFYQPQGVLIDTSYLATLPDRELKAGLAEVIKYGFIYDAAFFDWLENNINDLLQRDPEKLAYAIRRSCEIKAAVVAKDEKESGIRAILNFGHTFGHAIETGCGYGTYLHGEAVAIGMCLACELSHALNAMTLDEVKRGIQLIEQAGLPISLPESLSADDYLPSMALDKKNIDGEIRVIILNGIGQSQLPQAVGVDVLKQTIENYGAIRAGY